MRLFQVVSVVVSVASALINNLNAHASGPESVSGRLVGSARALDGDTLDLSTERGVIRVRLQGIDAAEGGQRCNMRWIGTWDCGRAASIALEQLVARQSVMCDSVGIDKYGRVLGICFAAERNINADLVREGLAWAFVQYSTLFVTEEAEARAARRGVWQAVTTAPWTWRAQQRGRTEPSSAPPTSLHDTSLAPQGVKPPQQKTATAAPAPSTAPAAPDGCAIKGNVTKAGERIYHTKASPWYERVRMDVGGGRRWFCNEGEAREAGWRPAGTVSANGMSAN